MKASVLSITGLCFAVINPVLAIAAAGVVPMITADRTSGVAPLAVHFDALSDSSGVIQPPLYYSRKDQGAYYYEWDFGDPGAGSFGTSGRSTNRAIGHIAAHVFEHPGEYNVRLGVTTPSGAFYEYSQTISVQVFSGATYYVSANGSDSNSGTSEGSALQTYNYALSKVNQNVRILFRRGDTFTTSGSPSLPAIGPVILGAYGPCQSPDRHGICSNNPIILVTSDSGSALDFQGSTSYRDWRVMDLHFTGTRSEGQGWGVAGGSGTQRGWLVYRCEFDDFYDNIFVNTWFSSPGGGGSDYNPATFHDRIFIVDSHLHDAVRYPIWAGGDRLVLLGSTIEESGRTHVIRLWYTKRSVLSSNIIEGARNGKHCLKFHAQCYGGLCDSTAADYSLIADNSFDRCGPWPVGLGPQDEFSPEKVWNAVFERNVIKGKECADGENAMQIALNLWGRYMVARNNLILADDSTPWVRGIKVSQRAGEPSPLGNRILNNTLYRGNSGSILYGVEVSGAADTAVFNNLVYGPQSGSLLSIEGGGTGLQAGGNIIAASDPFVAAEAEDFRLKAAAASLIDQGVLLPQGSSIPAYVAEDFAGTRRPQGGGFDIGAYEYVAGDTSSSSVSSMSSASSVPPVSSYSSSSSVSSSSSEASFSSGSSVSSASSSELTSRSSSSGASVVSSQSSFSFGGSSLTSASASSVLSTGSSSSSESSVFARLEPRLECVDEYQDGTYVARFGYLNRTFRKLRVPVGKENFFAPEPQDRGQPTRFLRGRVFNGFNVKFDGSKLSWVLNGIPLYASAESPRCCEGLLDLCGVCNGDNACLSASACRARADGLSRCGQACLEAEKFCDLGCLSLDMGELRARLAKLQKAHRKLANTLLGESGLSASAERKVKEQIAKRRALLRAIPKKIVNCTNPVFCEQQDHSRAVVQYRKNEQGLAALMLPLAKSYAKKRSSTADPALDAITKEIEEIAAELAVQKSRCRTE